MTIEVEAYHDLDAVAADAAGSLDRARQPALFDRLAWFDLTMRFVPPGSPLVLRARSGGALAWLFLAANGRRAVAMGSWYTLAFAPIFDGEPDAQTRMALLRALFTRLRRHAHSLSLHPLMQATADELRRALRAAGWLTRTAETSARWSTEAANWPAYWEARPSRLRNTVDRRRRKSPLEITLSTAFSLGEWEAYEEVFARSWKPLEGSMPFLRTLAEQEARAGTLRLAIGTVAGQPVAAQLWIVEGGVATVHKLAQDQAADSLSPGTQLTAAVIERLLRQEGPLCISFGIGDAAYKRDWTDRREPLLTLEAIDPRTPAGLHRGARWALAALVHRVRRS